MKDKKVLYRGKGGARFSLSSSSFIQNEPARSLSVSLFLARKKRDTETKKEISSLCDSEPRKHTDTTTKKGALETFHINNTLSTQTTHNALSRHHFRIWWEKHEDDDDDDDDAQRGGCDERSFIRRRRRRPRRKRRRASFFTIIEKKK